MSRPLHMEYLASAIDADKLPPSRAEVAFVGRSNVGKSSLLNALAGQKQLARVSNAPGRTKTLDCFRCEDGGATLVDCPGYGYAKVARSTRKAWLPMLEHYLLGRKALRRTVLLVDGEIGPTASDLYMLEWLREQAVPHAVVATKQDKVRPSRRRQRQRELAAGCQLPEAEVLFVSTTDNTGVSELRVRVREWMAPLLLVLLLMAAGCGGGSDAGDAVPLAPSPATRQRFAEHADPKTWTDLDPAHPGTRLRDPRTDIVFRRVPAGTFTMGGKLTPHEYPPHEVELTRDFLLAETEVTVAQWQRWVADCGGRDPAPVPRYSPQHPRTHLLFDEVAAFCAAYGYRLPSEAEWEHACRAGLGDEGPWQAQRTLAEHAWFHLNSKDGPQPVATRRANPFGFHDLLGSVWEYCSDRFVSGYGDGARAVDPTGPTEGQGHVLRGGSWFSMPGPTPAMRTGEEADPAQRRNAFTGFRPARSLD